MAISPHRQAKIYLDAAMAFGLGSDDLEEIAYFNKVKAHMQEDQKNRNIGITIKD